jgi:flagellar biosynthesis/type III secretory pathway protein FliH
MTEEYEKGYNNGITDGVKAGKEYHIAKLKALIEDLEKYL